MPVMTRHELWLLRRTREECRAYVVPLSKIYERKARNTSGTGPIPENLVFEMVESLEKWKAVSEISTKSMKSQRARNNREEDNSII